MTQETDSIRAAADSGVDEGVTSKFPGSTISIGGTGSGDNRVIPESEGGSIAKTGRYADHHALLV